VQRKGGKEKSKGTQSKEKGRESKHPQGGRRADMTNLKKRKLKGLGQ